MSAKKTTKRNARKIARKAAKTPLPSLVEPLDGASNLTEHNRILAKKRMLAALEKHMGVVLYACKEANVARRTHYMWMKEDKEYSLAVEDVQEGCGDFLERKMLEAVDEKQPAVMIFMAKTKYKNRGYVERHEIANPEGESFSINGKMTVEETKNELPPSAIKDIVEGIIKNSSKADAALKRLSES